MNHLVLILCLFTAFSSFAQTSISSAEILPQVGEQFTHQYGMYMLPGPGGENQIWDFSNVITNGGYLHTSYLSPESTLDSFFIKEVLVDDAALYDRSNYYQLSDSTLKLSYSEISIGNYEYHEPLLQFKFPLVYGDTLHDSVECIFEEYNVGSTSYSVVRTLMVDGEGDVVLPYGTFENVLRLKIVYPYQTVYLFYAPDIHTFIFRITEFDNGQFNFLRSTLLLENYLSTSDVVNPDELSVYPNPFLSSVNIKGDLSNCNKIQVINVQGKVLKEENLKDVSSELQIDLTELDKGIYFIRFYSKDNNTITTKRIIKNI